MNIKKQIKGFTLVELLVVIGIIAILFAVVLVAINPAKRFSEANNARRLSDVNSILNGVLNYTVDQKGSLPAGLKVVSTAGSENYIAVTPRIIGTSALTAAQSCQGLGTCTIPGFGSCTADSACDDNSCDLTTGKCKITGNTCTANSNCQLATPVATDCPAGLVCATGTPRAGSACDADAEDIDCYSKCVTGKCQAGVLAGRFCAVDADCQFTDATATGSTCAVDSITELTNYDLGAAVEGVVPAYLASVPKDPQATTGANTLYAIENVKGAGRIRVIACTPQDPEGDGMTDNKIEVIR